METSLIYHIDKGLCIIIAPGGEPSGYLNPAVTGVEGCEKESAFVCCKLPADQAVPGLGVEVVGGSRFRC